MHKFVPKPGQIDYTHIRRAPVINCVVKFEDKILLVRRSAELNFYPGVWNGISGFLDDEKTVVEKAQEELGEELGIKPGDIIRITEGKVFEQEEPKYDKVWVVHPVLVEVKTNQIKLDWEAKEFAWVDPKVIEGLELLPGFDRVLQTFFKSEFN